MKKIIAIVFAFTVLACTKEQEQPKQEFTLTGTWRTAKFYDQIFQDTAYEVFEIFSDKRGVKRYYGNSGFQYFKSIDKVTFDGHEITYHNITTTTKQEYIYLDEKTIFLKYDVFTKCYKVK